MSKIIASNNEQVLLDYFSDVSRSSQPLALAMHIDTFCRTRREELTDVVRRTALTDLDYKIEVAKKSLVDYYFAIFGSGSIVASIIAFQNDKYDISSIFNKIGMTAIVAAICFRYGYKIVEKNMKKIRDIIENSPLLVYRVLNSHRDELSLPRYSE